MRKLALVLVLVGACSDDDGGSIGIDDLQGALVNAYCNLYVSCGLIDDLATCRSLDLDAEIDNDVKAAVHAGKIIYHSDKASECLAGLNAGCEQGNGFGTEDSEACDQVFEGTVSEGGQCALDEECISDICSVPICPDACCQGTCAAGDPPTRPRLGESCADSTNCVNSFCDQATLLCTAHLADGSACTTSSQCESAACVTQLCRTRVGTGQPCSPTAPCRMIGDLCSPTTMTCTPYGLTGDACTAENQCSPIYNCDPATSQCALGARVGDACGPNMGCIDDSFCDPTTMTCTARRADGQSCMDDSECESSICDFDVTNTCLPDPVCF